jgi:hypothetical protein
MTTFFVYVLPTIVMILICWFLRTCTRLENGKKIPRFLLLILMLLSPIPVLGLILSITSIFTVPILIGCEELEVVDNKFTRFWIKD